MRTSQHFDAPVATKKKVCLVVDVASSAPSSTSLFFFLLVRPPSSDSTLNPHKKRKADEALESVHAAVTSLRPDAYVPSATAVDTSQRRRTAAAKPPSTSRLASMEPSTEGAEPSTSVSPSVLVEHPYASFDELLFERLRMEALDEMERCVRYSLDVNEDLSSLAGGFLRPGVFGTIADLTGASIISHLFDPVTPSNILDMKLSVHSALQAPTIVRIESRLLRHGDTLAFVRTRFYTDEKPIAQAKTIHYIASSSARRRPQPHDSS